MWLRWCDVSVEPAKHHVRREKTSGSRRNPRGRIFFASGMFGSLRIPRRIDERIFYDPTSRAAEFGAAPERLHAAAAPGSVRAAGSHGAAIPMSPATAPPPRGRPVSAAKTTTGLVGARSWCDTAAVSAPRSHHERPPQELHRPISPPPRPCLAAHRVGQRRYRDRPAIPQKANSTSARDTCGGVKAIGLAQMIAVYSPSCAARAGG